MYSLYLKPGACSMAVHAILHEINVPFEAHIMDATTMKQEAFLKLNPRGAVPVLADDGFVIREGAAIITWLCDKHGFPHWPQISVGQGHGRAAALQWLAYMNATLHPAYSTLFSLPKTIQDAGVREQVELLTRQKIQAMWDELNQQLASTTYLCGEQPSPADFLMTVIANWMDGFIFGPNLQRTLKAVSSRPSFQAALQHEKINYKAAA